MYKEFPALFKKTSTGALQTWKICVDYDKIITFFGQVGGAIQETAPTICQGKNLGKANSTTGETQALLEAEAQWTKKLKKDYVKTPEEAMAGKSSELIEGGILPMLAHKFSEQGHKIKYPCACQGKLDGHRCIAVIDENGKCTLWSRTRKQIFSAPHIVAEIEKKALKSYVLDGELYNSRYNDRFEELTSLIRQEVPSPNCTEIEYHIYDYPIADKTFEVRNQLLRTWFMWPEANSHLVYVETLKVNDEDELMLAFNKFLADGYEGAIARNVDGMYVNKRSYDLQKIKEFDDAEFKIVGVEEGKGKLAGHGIFVCVTDEGQTFNAKMKGSTEALKDYLEHPEKYIGKLLTVQHQGKSASKIPRFPVALHIRQDV